MGESISDIDDYACRLFAEYCFFAHSVADLESYLSHTSERKHFAIDYYMRQWGISRHQFNRAASAAICEIQSKI